MTALTLYGKPTYAYTVLRNAISNTINEAELGVNLEEIQSTNDIVSKGISKIPAVSIDNNIHVLENEAIHNYANKVIFNLLELENFGSLVRIIVPVNNAHSSLHGLIYAKQLSMQLRSIVTAINYIDSSSRQYKKHIHISVDGEDGYNNTSLTDFAKNLNLLRDDHDYLPIQPKFVAHNPSQLIINMANARRNNLVILSYDQNTGLLDGLMKNQLKAINCPIIIVPSNYTQTGIDNILHYSNFNNFQNSEAVAIPNELRWLDHSDKSINISVLPENKNKEAKNAKSELSFLDKHCTETEVDLITLAKSYSANKIETLLNKVARPVMIMSLD